MQSIDTVPDGFTLRAPTLDDAGDIADLINEVTVAEAGFPWTTVEETRDELTTPDREAGLPDVLLLDGDGSLAGYLQLWKSEPVVISIQAFVRPDHWGRGLSTWLIRHGERLTAEWSRGSETPVATRVARFAHIETARRLFVELGYAYVRTFWMMRIELATTPMNAGAVPDGIAIRTFERGKDERPVYDAMFEAFADHWGSWSETFEQWMHGRIDGEGAEFDPTLWFIAVEGEEIVGAACCSGSSPRAKDTGEVNTLGVRRPWRRRGVGLALLETAFAEMRRRGISSCELGVDAENPTGATRLYERAGMHVAYKMDSWDKTLSVGRG